MLGHAKKHHTDTVELMMRIGKQPKLYIIPRETAEGIAKIIQLHEISEKNKPLYAEDVFPDLSDKHLRPATALRGARHKENLSQVALAKRLNIEQSDLSKMEHGKRAIGKAMAKRLAAVLDVDYRIFL